MRARIAVTVAAVSAAAAVLGAVALASGQSGSYGGSTADKLEKRALFAVLTGKKEVDSEGNKRAGDPDGRGSFTATIDGTELCFGITVKNIDTPVAAHIHKAPRNEAGPVIVPLTAPSSGDPGASSGCVEVKAADAEAILRHPHRYYANVHTAPFPDGAVRGQLFRKSN